MPTWDEILKESESYNPIVLVDKYLSEVSSYTDKTTICYFSAFTIAKTNIPNQTFLSIVDQDIQGFMTCSKDTNKDAVNLILHTPGGDYEATKRIINYLLNTYKEITVFVPHLALSGGTLIACAADEIYMGPYSNLGPTDPQVFIGGNLLPAGAIVNEFKRAFLEVKEDPNKAILWAKRIEKVPIGLIDSLEIMIKNSEKYLVELLSVKNCKDKDCETIKKIAQTLNTHSHHSSHDKGISLKEAKELGLNVKDLREDKELEDKVLSVYHAITVLFLKTPVTKIIANNLQKRFIMQVPPKIELI
jgi:hypothetical protein